MNKKILLIEDSALITKVLKHLIRSQTQLECQSAETLEQAQAILTEDADQFFAAVVDLNLPDAPNGEVLDYVLQFGLPCIVLTASFDEGKRESILQKPVVDYVVKESRYSYEYVTQLIRRLVRNQDIKVLVADDSETSRTYISRLLRNHLYQVSVACNGTEALEAIQRDPEIALLIVDHHMPDITGFEVTRLARREYDRKDLIIIGLSGYGNAHLSARFIKNGANDFLVKPFLHEEFHCRIMQNVEAMETMVELRDAATRDYLTKLYNRRHLFETVEPVYQEARQTGRPLTVAMLDIDRFKAINDRYGHETGDQVIRLVADHLRAAFPDHLSARFGGEEFCVVFDGVELAKAQAAMEGFRTTIEQSRLPVGDEALGCTVSIGITDQTARDLDEMISLADRALYRAKDEGRNRLCASC